jgi:hypothetical protein
MQNVVQMSQTIPAQLLGPKTLIARPDDLSALEKIRDAIG